MVSISNRQKGYTLIEVIVAVAITAFLGTGVTAFTVQTMTETQKSSYHMQTIQQLENAGYWITRDVQMSQNVTTGLHAGFPLQLQWIDENDDIIQVTFDLTNGEIRRSIAKNGETPLNMVIAQSINPEPALTSCNYTNGMLDFKATATIGTWSTNRTYRITQRVE